MVGGTGGEGFSRETSGPSVMSPAPLVIPPAFAQRIVDALGEAGTAWLRDLPTLVDDLSSRWGIAVGAPFELSFNYVARARLGDGSDAVFKVGPWEDGEIGREI